MAALLPLIVGAAAHPPCVIMALLLLRGKGGVAKAAAFVAGAVAARVVQGILFGYVFAAAADACGEEGERIVDSVVLSVVGIVLLITVVRTWRRQVGSDARPPKWMTTFSDMSVRAAFGVGALMMVVAITQLVFTLSAIAVIDEGQLSPTGNVLAYLGFVAGSQLLVLALIIGIIFAPDHSARVLEKTQGWLERNNRSITIVVSLILGMWFLGKGIAGFRGIPHPQAKEVAAAPDRPPTFHLLPCDEITSVVGTIRGCDHEGS